VSSHAAAEEMVVAAKPPPRLSEFRIHKATQRASRAVATGNAEAGFFESENPVPVCVRRTGRRRGAGPFLPRSPEQGHRLVRSSKNDAGVWDPPAARRAQGIHLCPT